MLSSIVYSSRRLSQNKRYRCPKTRGTCRSRRTTSSLLLYHGRNVDKFRESTRLQDWQRMLTGTDVRRDWHTARIIASLATNGRGHPQTLRGQSLLPFVWLSCILGPQRDPNRKSTHQRANGNLGTSQRGSCLWIVLPDF